LFNPIFKAAIIGILIAIISGSYTYYIGKELKKLKSKSKN